MDLAMETMLCFIGIPGFKLWVCQSLYFTFACCYVIPVPPAVFNSPHGCSSAKLISELVFTANSFGTAVWCCVGASICSNGVISEAWAWIGGIGAVGRDVDNVVVEWTAFAFVLARFVCNLGVAVVVESAIGSFDRAQRIRRRCFLGRESVDWDPL